MSYTFSLSFLRVSGILKQIFFMFKKTLKFFDKLEDKIRHQLSKTPLLYAIIGGVAIVLFWRGVWHLADDWGMSSLTSLIISVVIMLATGTFVSFFIGEQILLSGLREEKRLDEKTEEEIEQEDDRIANMRHEIDEIRDDVEEIKSAVSPAQSKKTVKKEVVRMGEKQKADTNIKIKVIKK
ncbi:MAG: hypothetical protein M1320_01600 [Patescibacteria group bacterium]|nr:hypothetical protein [Patescibacteria group bacterium]